MKISKQVCHDNLIVFIQQIVDLALQGWEVDERNPPMLLGYLYECQMLRDEEVVDPPPKPTRAEILAKAREAKKAKSEGKSDDTPDEEQTE